MREGVLKALDADYLRLQPKALSDGLPRGHYKLPFVERLAPRRREYGPGRIFIADLTRRDIAAMIEDEKAEPTLDDDRIRIAQRASGVGRLAGFTDASIHGGGDSLSQTMALSNFQPLTIPTHGIRIHNADLLKLMNMLEPRLRCLQLIILTIC